MKRVNFKEALNCVITELEDQRGMPYANDSYVNGIDCALSMIRELQSTEPEELPASPLEASAPEMLAKLEEIEKVISEWPALQQGGDYLHGWILNSTRDVIAKAKGVSR